MKRLLFLVLLVAAGGAAWLYSGAYDIGADAPHWALTEKLIDVLRDRSIETRLADIKVPNLDDPALIEVGTAHYVDMCVACHLAPGLEDTEIRQGLYPEPPKLADPWPSDPREQFWAIKHGIKLTAMPAWGKSHDDESIWGLVAFLKKLQGMTPEQFNDVVQHVEIKHDEAHHHKSDQTDSHQDHDEHE